jgi:hypothetical protein
MEDIAQRVGLPQAAEVYVEGFCDISEIQDGRFAGSHTSTLALYTQLEVANRSQSAWQLAEKVGFEAEALRNSL